MTLSSKFPYWANESRDCRKYVEFEQFAILSSEIIFISFNSSVHIKRRDYGVQDLRRDGNENVIIVASSGLLIPFVIMSVCLTSKN